jgi:hypothetical protein
MKTNSFIYIGMMLGAAGALRAQDFTYTTNADQMSITITGYLATNTTVVIPPTLDGFTVTEIGELAFNRASLTSLTLPNTLTRIGIDAFNNTQVENLTIPGNVIDIDVGAFSSSFNLTNLTLSEGVQSIGFGAFDGCVALPSVNIPASVTDIEPYSFAQCYAMTQITVDPESAAFSAANGALFDHDMTTLLQYPGGVGGSYTIPDGVTSIESYAFYSDYQLESVTFPGTVAKLEDYSFQYCYALTNLLFLGNAPTADTNVFTDDNNAVVYYEPGATGFGAVFAGLPAMPLGGGGAASPFTYTTNADNVSITITGYTGTDSESTIPETIDGFTVTAIGDHAFDGSTTLNDIVVPATMTKIGDFAFANNLNFYSITFDGNAPSVGADVFDGDYYGSVYYYQGAAGFSDTFGGLYTYVLFPRDGDYSYAVNEGGGSVTVEGYYGADGPVTIPDTIAGLPVTAIATSAFGNLGITSVTFPATVATIEGSSFDNTALTHVFIPSTVTYIGPEAFGLCAHLTAIDVDPANPFYSSINGVLFDKDQTTIWQYPAGRSGTYVIPNGVTRIGASAFDGGSLTGVSIPNTVTDLGVASFFDCQNLVSITLPASVTRIEDSAFSSGYVLRSVYCTGNAPEVGNYVFLFDDNATVFYLPGTTGWQGTLAGRPTQLWNPAVASNGSLGVQNNQFGFNVIGPTNLTFVLQAATNLTAPSWFTLQTVTLSNGSFQFSEPLQTNVPGRFYRLNLP